MSEKKVLYVFRGEGASGGEIVIKRLIYNNKEVTTHISFAPCKFADDLIAEKKVEHIILFNELKSLNRSQVNPVTFYLKALSNYLTLSYKLYKYVVKHKIGVVHANTIVPAAYLLPAVIFSRFFNNNIKWVWSDHDLKYFSKLDEKQSYWCAALYNKTLAVSDAVKSKYEAEKNAVVLYNGLDINLFKANILEREKFREKHDLNNAKLVFGLAGTIAPRKGQVMLVQAFKQLIGKYPNVMLLFAGSGASDHPVYLQEFMNEINNIHQIQYIGKITDMMGFYNACDVIVSNSSYAGSEPLGTTIYEAMSCEKIVIASNTGGSPEIIDNGVDGILYQPDDVDELVQTLRNVINNYQDMEFLKVNSRKKVITKFNIQVMTDNYNSILNDL
jgi:glycosyltransferase involved in cell wall biosynthesis